MTAELIELDVQSSIATVRLNRPEKRNAFDDVLRDRFIAVLEEVAADRGIRALVLTGNGKAFCAGGDIAAMRSRLETPAGDVAFNGWKRQHKVHHVQGLLHNLPIPTIAAVNGAAAGLGADTALACDFVVASRDASFAWSYVHRGLISDGGGMYFLPRRIGLSRTKELIFTGRQVEADEALRLGIVDRLSVADELVADAQAWARELTKGSAVAIALGKSIVNQSFESSPEQIFDRGSPAQAVCYTTAEHRQSVEAFLATLAARKA